MAGMAWRTRIQAAMVHFGGSVFVAMIAAALVFLLWYPWPYSTLAGGSKLFSLIVAVDVVMGPVITFAIFDRAKLWRELRRDLAVIVLLQLAALGYGMHTMYAARPVALALEGNRFRVVTANRVLAEQLAEAAPEFRQLPIAGPIVVRTSLPADSAVRMKLVELAMSGHDIGTQPAFWRAWDTAARSEALAASKPVSELRTRYSLRTAEIDAAVAKTGRTEQQLGYLPIVSRFADWVALVDLSTGEIVGYAPFDGF